MSNLNSRKENAAPTGIGSGVGIDEDLAKASGETYENHPADASGDAYMCRVDIPDARPFVLKIADGTRLPVRCDPAGLIQAYDFLIEDGSVIRQERRLVTLVPGMSELEGQRSPYLSSDSIEGKRRDKALLLALWNGLSVQERTAFLGHVGLECAA